MLTGSPTVTTPCSEITLGCQNCPIMAASCRNQILSLSEAISFRLFTATTIDSESHDHRPLQIWAKWPEPTCSRNLHSREGVGVVLGCVTTTSHHLWPWYLSVSLGSQLGVESRGSGGRGPVHFGLFEEAQLVIMMLLFLWRHNE